jgi:antirestriction protein
MLLQAEGAEAVVIQDATSYQRFLQEVDQLETIAAVKQSREEVAAGRDRPIREALAELAAKHRLPTVQDP